MNTESASKTDTLFGGRTASVIFLDGSKSEIKVRQLPLTEYTGAFNLADDEIGLTAYICGIPREKILQVTPESYEALQAAAQEVNAKGFFVYCARQMQRAAEQIQSLGTDILRLAVEASKSTLPITSQPLRPKRV
jgi:hypothetical protein